MTKSTWPLTLVIVLCSRAFSIVPSSILPHFVRQATLTWPVDLFGSVTLRKTAFTATAWPLTGLDLVLGLCFIARIANSLEFSSKIPNSF